MDVPEIKQAHCNCCGGERRNEVLFTRREHASDGFGARLTLYEVLKCCGCEAIRFCRIEIDSADREISDKVTPHVTYYPAAIFRKTPDWMSDLFLEAIGQEDIDFVYDILQEIYRALHGGSQSLAAMGIRALLEFMMVKHVHDHGTFGKNLTEFQRQGFISAKDVDHIKAILEVGNAAIHRGHRPNRDDVVAALDMSEALLKRLYLDEGHVQQLRKSTPPRA